MVTYYRQCNFKKGKKKLTCWVEDRVKVGNIVDFKDMEKDSDGWEVVKVGAIRFEEAYIKVNKNLELIFQRKSLTIGSGIFR